MKKKLFIIGGILVSLLYISDVKAWTFYDNNSNYNAYGNEQIVGAATNCDGVNKITSNNQCGFPNSSTQFVTTAFSEEKDAKNFCEVSNNQDNKINNSVKDWINKGYRCQINERKNDPYYYAYKYPLFINGHHTLREVTKEGNNVIMYVYRIYPIIINYASDPVNPDSYGWYRPPYPGGVYSKDIELTSEYNDDYYAFAYTFDGNANTSDQYDSYDYKTVYGDDKPKKIEYIDSSLLNGEQYNINSGDYKLSDVTVIEAGKNIVESNKRIKSGEALFYNDTAGPQAFLKKYTLNTSKDNYGSDGKKVTIKKGYIMKTINNSAYGEVIKALEDNDVSDQRDYAYYHVYLTKYTFKRTTPAVRTCSDNKNISPKIKEGEENNVCKESTTKKIVGECIYDDNPSEVKIKNFYKLSSTQRPTKGSSSSTNDEKCYITSPTGDGTIETISYSFNDVSSTGINTILEKKLTIKQDASYVIYNYTDNQTESSYCFKNGNGSNWFHPNSNFNKITKLDLNNEEVTLKYNNIETSIPLKCELDKANSTVDENGNCVTKSSEIMTTSGNGSKQEVKRNCTWTCTLNTQICRTSTGTSTDYTGNNQNCCVVNNSNGKIYANEAGTINISYDRIDNCKTTVNGSNRLNYIYRPISLENPFPGIRGDGRKIGGNWRETDSGIDPVEVYITEKDIHADTPMYIINLTPEVIRNIRSNYSNNYTEDIVTQNGKQQYCEALNNGTYSSGLITDLNRNNSQTVTGRCIRNGSTGNNCLSGP